MNVERVVLALFCQLALTLCQRVAQEGVAVAGKDQTVGLEIEGIDGYQLFGNRETVDDGVLDILLFHTGNDVGQNIVACGIVVEQAVDGGSACSQQLLGIFGTFGSINGFGRFGIVYQLTVEQALAVAHHPYLALQTAVDDGRAGETVFGVFGKLLKARLGIVLADVGCDTTQKLMTRHLFWGVTQVAADKSHSLSAIAAEKTMAIGGFRRRAVDDGNEVRGDDDAVLAFALWVLGDEGLFDDLHDRDRVRE